MLIKLLTSRVGPYIGHQPAGCLLAVPRDIERKDALALLESRQAELVKEVREKAIKRGPGRPKKETAVSV